MGKSIFWIPVSQGLPPTMPYGDYDTQISDDVIVTTRKKQVKIDYTVNGEWMHDVIAWMPMPDPYTGDNDESQIYDLDKVVKQLEDLRGEAEQFGVSGILDDIIEIVKGGYDK